MKKIEPPATMSRADKKTFRRLVLNLMDQGIDPGARSDLLRDFVQLEARVSALATVELAAKGKARAGATRAINVATAERRRLHAALFAGSRVATPATTSEETSDAARQREADEAWRGFFHRRAWQPDRAAAEAALRERYGRTSWNALLYETYEEQCETEKICRKFKGSTRAHDSAENS